MCSAESGSRRFSRVPPSQSDVTSVQTYWVTGSVMMGLGALSLGAALILWPRSPARVTAGFSPSPRSMEWLLRFEL
jgi:hypothetical protein